MKIRETNFPQNTIEVGDVVILAPGLTEKKALLSNVPAKVTDVYKVGTIEVKEIKDDGNGMIRKFFFPEDLNIIKTNYYLKRHFISLEVRVLGVKTHLALAGLQAVLIGA